MAESAQARIAGINHPIQDGREKLATGYRFESKYQFMILDLLDFIEFRHLPGVS